MQRLSLRFHVSQRTGDLTIAPGEKLAIVGLTVRAKAPWRVSFPRLLDPSEGAVYIDGEDIRNYQLQSLREHVSLIRKTPYCSKEPSVTTSCLVFSTLRMREWLRPLKQPTLTNLLSACLTGTTPLCRNVGRHSPADRNSGLPSRERSYVMPLSSS